MLPKNGFTLIEIVIVIAIIAVLSVIGLTSYSRFQHNAQITKVTADMQIIEKNINVARIFGDITLTGITGNGCSECTPCRNVPDLRNVPDTHACVVRWKSIQSKLATYNADISEIDRDPWGSPFLVDENEGEQPTNPCRKDRINSVGPDGIFGNDDDINLSLQNHFQYPNIPACNPT